MVLKNLEVEATMSKLIKGTKVRDFARGLILILIIKNPITTSMANKESIIYAIEDLVIINNEYIIRCLRSWVDRWGCVVGVLKKYKGYRVNVCLVNSVPTVPEYDLKLK